MPKKYNEGSGYTKEFDVLARLRRHNNVQISDAMKRLQSRIYRNVERLENVPENAPSTERSFAAHRLAYDLGTTEPTIRRSRDRLATANLLRYQETLNDLGGSGLIRYVPIPRELIVDDKFLAERLAADENFRAARSAWDEACNRDREQRGSETAYDLANDALAGANDSFPGGLTIPGGSERGGLDRSPAENDSEKINRATPSLRSGVSARDFFDAENDEDNAKTDEQPVANKRTFRARPDGSSLSSRAVVTATNRAAELAEQGAAELDALARHSSASKGERSEIDRATQALLDVAVELVFRHLSDLGFTRKHWQRQNRQVAREMAEAGTTPETLALAVNTYYTHPTFAKWAHLHRLEIIRDRLAQLRAAAKGDRKQPSPYAGIERA